MAGRRGAAPPPEPPPPAQPASTHPTASSSEPPTLENNEYTPITSIVAGFALVGEAQTGNKGTVRSTFHHRWQRFGKIGLKKSGGKGRDAHGHFCIFDLSQIPSTFPS